MTEIVEYLNSTNPGFGQGFRIFCKYSRNQSLMSYIGRKSDMELLVYELQKLANMGILSVNPNFEAQHIRFNKDDAGASTKDESPKGEERERVHIVDERHVNRGELPEELKKIYDEITDDYKVQRSLHEKMKQANSDTGRKEFRDEVVKLQLSITAKWQLIDVALANGTPVEVNPVASDRVHVSSHRAYISKMLAKPKLTKEQREAVKKKVEELLNLGETLKPETLKRLKEKGF